MKNIQVTAERLKCRGGSGLTFLGQKMISEKPVPFSIDFPFLGRRQYIHSTSISNFWAGFEPDADGYELVLRRWIRNRIVFTPFYSVPTTAAGYVVITKCGIRQFWAISEDKSYPVAIREEYNEAMVPVNVDCDALAGEVGPADGFSFFDRLIPGNKALINQCLQPCVSLIAAKIKTTGFPAADSKFTLRLKNHVGTRLFKTEILANNSFYGEIIYFGK